MADMSEASASDAVVPIVLFALGYVVGTLQILAVDWYRAIQAHQQQIRLLRGLLKGAVQCDRKIACNPARPLHYIYPVVPDLGPRLHETLAGVDFTRSDEAANADEIVSVLNAENGCWMLREMRRQFLVERDRTSAATDPIEQSKAWISACAAASTYDQKLDEVIPALREGVAEMERRLKVATLGQQLRRKLGSRRNTTSTVETRTPV